MNHVILVFFTADHDTRCSFSNRGLQVRRTVCTASAPRPQKYNQPESPQSIVIVDCPARHHSNNLTWDRSPKKNTYAMADGNESSMRVEGHLVGVVSSYLFRWIKQSIILLGLHLCEKGARVVGPFRRLEFEINNKLKS